MEEGRSVNTVGVIRGGVVGAWTRRPDGGGAKWMESGCVLMAEPIGSADGSGGVVCVKGRKCYCLSRLGLPQPNTVGWGA